MWLRTTLILVAVSLAITGDLAAQPANCAIGIEEIGGIYYDADGLIVHKPTPEHPCGDGGDTAQREGWYWLGVWLRQNTPGLEPFTPTRRLTFNQVLRLLEPNGDGVFHRHPKLPPWNNPHSKEFGLSRDQMVPLVAAMGMWGKQEELRRLWDALPEDALGKHTFNGNWRNLLGQDGVNCTDIKRRGCDATRDCSLKTDNRDCSLKVDTRSCPLQEDTRSCNVCLVSNPFGGCILYGNDPACEIAKAAQNAIYKANKDACEAAKAAQNVIYAGEKAACESAKTTQNAIYKADKDACEAAKATEKAACEVQKTVDLNLCRLNNVHSGDFVGPATENLFSRAMNQSLWHSLGEAELLANTLLRVGLGSNRDDTGDDLNLIIMLVMSQLRSPTAESRQAVSVYSNWRPFSYGSYLESYRTQYGRNDATDMTSRMDDGIRRGWRPDAPAVNGAVRWYHRIETGGNPGLADLYEPIIDRFIYGDTTSTFRTQAARNAPPQVTSVSPATGTPDGGTVITISGSNFIDGTTILIGGTAPSNLTVIDQWTMTAVTPAHSAGPVDVTVTVPWPGGGTTIANDAFNYLPMHEQAPTEPTGLAASTDGSSVTLTWNAAAGASAYMIEAGSAPGLSDVVRLDLGSVTAYTTEAYPGAYYVRVRAANVHGTSGASNEVIVTVEIEPKVPQVPTLSSRVNGMGVDLSWTASVGARSYVLEAGTRPGHTDVFLGDLGATTTFSTTAPPGTYFARVRARGAAGVSGPSNEVAVVVYPCEPPIPPAGLAASREGAHVVLTWTPSSAASSYVLEAGSGAGLANLFHGEVGNVPRFATTAPPGTYYVRIRARSFCGESGASNEIVVMIP